MNLNLCVRFEDVEKRIELDEESTLADVVREARALGLEIPDQWYVGLHGAITNYHLSVGISLEELRIQSGKTLIFHPLLD